MRTIPRIKKQRRLVNHIGLMVDNSGSMTNMMQTVNQILSDTVNEFDAGAKSADQVTKITLWSFNSDVTLLASEMDSSLQLPIVPKSFGNTSLRDAIVEGITYFTQFQGDNEACLLFVITDGQENSSHKFSKSELTKIISGKQSNLTIGVLVPDVYGVAQVVKEGIPSGNVTTWDATTTQGVEEMGESLVRSTKEYYNLRSTGVRSSTRLFNTDLSEVSTKLVAKSDTRKLRPKDYNLYPVKVPTRIDDFVVTKTKAPYVVGNAYYRLDKPEIVQGNKEIVLKNRKTGEVYEGTGARALVGLPTYDLKATPGHHGEWDIFIQSKSLNRKLFPGSEILVLNS